MNTKPKHYYSAESMSAENNSIEVTYVKRHFTKLPKDYEEYTCWGLTEKAANKLIGDNKWVSGGTECDYDVVVLSETVN